MTPPLSALLGALLAASAAAAGAAPDVPATPAREVRETLHGVEVVDPYRWLEDQWSPETRAWIGAQNAYTDSVLAPLPQREAFRRRLGELLKVDTVTVPIERSGRSFYERRPPGQEQFVIVMRDAAGVEKVLIDPHPRSADHTTSVDLMEAAEDGKRLVYAIREGGQDEVVACLFDVDAGRDAAESLPKGRYTGFALSPDGRHLYYGRHSQQLGPRVFVHRFGTDPATDRELFGQGFGPEKIVGVSLSADGKWVVLTVLEGSAAERTEIHLLDAAAEPGARAPLAVVKGLAARSFADVADGRAYVRTNWKAPRGRVLAVDLADPRPESWRELVPESRATLENMILAGGHLFAEYLDDVRSQVKVFAPDGRLVRDIGFPAAGTVNGFSGDWNRPRLYFAFQSLHMPPAIFRHDAKTGGQDAFWRSEVPFDSDAFEVRQEWYASKDGTRVPLFLVHRKGLARNIPHPTVLTGYGGFTVSQTPSWSPRVAGWIDAGGVYAVAGLRGGGEFGEEWHRAGMRERKQNTFDDFIAAAEWLIAQGYTKREHLAITGGSNGGLLTGAALTQRPELFAAVVSRYPLLDMVRYHKFLVARFWVPEYGSAESAEEFRVLRAYSPYHNVKKGGRYPALLFMTGDGDTRVDPLHGRKMAALMQASQGSDEPVLLRYDVKAGHSAGVPVALQIDELADELTFMAWQTGLGARAREEKVADDVTNVSDADVAAWPAAQRRLGERYPAAATVVPGHGAVGGTELLARTGELRAAARAARRPERTAPSMTAGSAVSVQSPAR